MGIIKSETKTRKPNKLNEFLKPNPITKPGISK